MPRNPSSTDLPRVWPSVWTALVDDAAVFPPGDLPLAEALAAHREHRASPYGDLLGTFVLRDTDLPGVRGFEHPVSVVVTGGAGQIAGPLGLAARLGVSLGASSSPCATSTTSPRTPAGWSPRSTRPAPKGCWTRTPRSTSRCPAT
ncbi:hypothetical protein [Nocardioides houyundeii]|uniref:hypothetical protein n=1 Tax=Nocardioides houyundeii TaxID=2045452 RepID=UPI0013158DF7|nr:hypothetical protein [Nocardioides houyundeii]